MRVSLAAIVWLVVALSAGGCGTAGLETVPPSTTSVSADGRFIAFGSSRSDLVDGDTNGESDVFVVDRLLDQTVRVSVSSEGVEGNGDSGDPSISADGRYVAFESLADTLVDGDLNDRSDVFVHDTATGVTTRVSVDRLGGELSSGSVNPSISDDGWFVVFETLADADATGDLDEAVDVFVHDRLTGETRRVSR